MIEMNNYYLDIKAVFKLPKDHASMIENIFHRLLDSLYANPNSSTEVYFNTLVKGGYLKNKLEEEREEKIELING